MIVLWNTIYIQAALDQIRAEVFTVLKEDVAGLSPLAHDHITMFGRYSFAATAHKPNRCRSLTGLSVAPQTPDSRV